MKLSVKSVVGRPQNRLNALGVGGSILLHAGLASYFLLQPPIHPNAAAHSDVDADQPVSLTLVRLSAPSQVMSLADATGETVPTPPVNLRKAIRRGSGLAAPPRAKGAGPRADVVGAQTPVLTPTSAPAAAAPAAAASAASTGSDYQRILLEHIAPYRRYPEAASHSGARGVVVLAFQIDRAGHVLGVWVSQSSGSSLLDTAAIDTIRRAAPLPPIPASLPDAVLVRLPVDFTDNG